jgi:hypothetical protein
VLVVLTRGIQDGAKSSKLIADVSSLIYARNSAHSGSATVGTAK